MERSKLIMFYELCRLCLERPGATNIFEERDLPHKIYVCTSLKVHQSDNLPQKICVKCLDIINKSNEFRALVVKNDAHLRSLFDSDSEEDILRISTDPPDTISSTSPENKASVHSNCEENKCKDENLASDSDQNSSASTKLSIRKDLFEPQAVSSSIKEKPQKKSSKKTQKDDVPLKKVKRESEEYAEYECQMASNPRRPNPNKKRNLFDHFSDDENFYDPYNYVECEYGSDGNNEPEYGDVSSESDLEAFSYRKQNFTKLAGVSDSESGSADTESDKETDDDVSAQPKSNSDANIKPIDKSADHIPHDNDNELLEHEPHGNNSTEHSLRSVPTENNDVPYDRPNISDFGELDRFLNLDTVGHFASKLQEENEANQRPNIELSTNDEWKDTPVDIPEFNFDNTTPGPCVHIDDNTSAEELFDLMFTQDIIDYMVTCTNAHGKSLANENRPQTLHSRNRVFHEVNAEEMKKFIGLSLLQGQIKVSERRKLFTLTDPLYYHPIFNHVMSARRYEQILRCLSVSVLNAKGFGKVNTFIDMVTQNFRNLMNPKKELLLYESLMLFRGRSNFRTYMKSLTKYAIKFYILATADGYVLNFLMYCGNEGQKLEDLVLRLMSPYLLKGHELYMDNSSSSVALSEQLLDLKTHTAGILRSKRKENPRVLTKTKLKKGEHIWLRKNKVYVSNWRHKRPVLMLTTLDHPGLVEVNKRGQKRMKPKELLRYNTNISGINRTHQMISAFSSSRKISRWYTEVILHMLDLATWNAYYFFSKLVKKNHKCEYGEYRDKLIKKLLKIDENVIGKDLVKNAKTNWNRRERRGISSSTGATQEQPGPSSSTISGIAHWPIRIPAKDFSKKKFAFLNCRNCQLKKLRHETSYRCKGCPNSPPLCPTCFEEWHMTAATG